VVWGPRNRAWFSDARWEWIYGASRKRIGPIWRGELRDGERYCGARKVYRCVWEQTGGEYVSSSPKEGENAHKLTMTILHLFRVLSAVGALSCPYGMHRWGVTRRAAVDSGIPRASREVGQTLTRIDFQRGTETSVLSSRGMAGWP